MKPHIFSTLFFEFVLILPHPFSTVATTSQLFAALLKPSQLFSIPTTLFNSLKSFHPLPPLLNSSHLFSSHLRSTHLTSFSVHLNSSHRFPLVTEMFYIENLCTQKFLRTDASAPRNFYTEIFKQRNLYTLHTEPFTNRNFAHIFLHTTIFYTEKLLHTAIFYTENLSLRESVTKRDFYTEKFLVREPFTQKKNT